MGFGDNMGGGGGDTGGGGTYHEVLHVPHLLVDVVQDLAAALGRLLHLGPLTRGLCRGQTDKWMDGQMDKAEGGVLRGIRGVA